MGTLNWGKLVAEGRAKDIGISWSEEEMRALYEFKIPPDYVRDGIVTLHDYQRELEKEASDGVKKLARWSKEELMKEADRLGINYSPDAPAKALSSEIKKRYSAIESKAAQAKALDEAHARFQEEELNKKPAAEEPVKEAAPWREERSVPPKEPVIEPERVEPEPKEKEEEPDEPKPSKKRNRKPKK